MVTQRIANPFIPVQFWAWPPELFLLLRIINHFFSLFTFIKMGSAEIGPPDLSFMKKMRFFGAVGHNNIFSKK